MRAFPGRVLLALLLLAATACIRNDDEGDGPAVPPQDDQPLPTDTAWTHHALLAGVDLWEDFTEAEVSAVLDQRVAEGATVVEADSGLSQYLTDAEFEANLNLMRLTVRLARDRGLKVIWYYPSLEVLTDDAANNASMAKDHPDWLQVNLEGKPNVFVGTEEFWVDPGTESAWMCPNGPYRDYFLDRIRRMAKTGIDGIWPDVPLFMDTAVMWNCANDACNQKFKAASIDAAHPDGMDPPKAYDMTDPVFRRWLHWRHETIDDFLRAILAAAQGVSPNIFVAAETFTMDYLDAMDKGLDGTYQRDVPGFTHMWEVDSVSNSNGMKCALPDDWTSKIAMFKFARGVDHSSATWAFSYGDEPLDAGLVMAEAFAAQVNPYELKTPQMLSTVDPAFRTRWFGWAKQRLPMLFDTTPAAQVAIVFSSASRDYLDDEQEGFGLYETTQVQCAPDPDWWSTSDGDAAASKVHLADYRGMVKLFTYAHIPFDVVPSQALSAERLAGYKVVVLPAMQAMSPTEVQAVTEWVSAGGTLIATGDNPSGMDEYGVALPDLGLAPVLDLHAGYDVTQVRHLARFGQGRAFWYADLLGQIYVDPEQAAVDGPYSFHEVTRVARLAGADPLWTDAPPEVHFELYRSADGQTLYLHAVNFTGLKAPMVLSPVTFQVELRLPDGKHAASVEAASPEDGAEIGPLSFETRLFGRPRFTMRVGQYSVIAITLADGAEGLPPATMAAIGNPALSKALKAAFAFVKAKLRDPTLPDPGPFGVYTNEADVQGSTEQYAYGHNVTSEHIGLMLLAAAAQADHDTFDGTVRYVRDVMRSPFYGLANWAIDKTTHLPMVQVDTPGEPAMNGNAPLDDFRVIRGLLLGHRMFGDPAYLDLARELAGGLRWTSVSDTDSDTAAALADYPGGVVGYAFNWVETSVPHSGEGFLDVSPVPIDYCDLAAVDVLQHLDPWWEAVLPGCVTLELAAEIGAPAAPKGLFHGSYVAETKVFSGDFESPDTAQGQQIKTIQSLWTALHLARYGAATGPTVPDADLRARATQAAGRALAFFKGFYKANDRVPEYLTPAGKDVPDCATNPNAPNCLYHGDPGADAPAGALSNLSLGEPRIYALLARLAVELGDPAFASQLVVKKILPWQTTDPASPDCGDIGGALAGDGLAEAWNVLESILAILEVSGSEPL